MKLYRHLRCRHSAMNQVLFCFVCHRDAINIKVGPLKWATRKINKTAAFDAIQIDNNR